MQHVAIILFLFILAPNVAVADNYIAHSCDRNQNQKDLNICSFEAYKNADEILNKVYQKALDIIGDSDEQEEKFRASQSAWIKYRDLTCVFESGPRENSGTIWPLIMNNCMLRHTKQRTEEIPYFFQEWDYY